MKKQAKKKPAAKKKRQRETGKTVVWVCLLNGFAWVWCSYALAFLDKTQIAESLSQVAVTEIIGVVLVYCLKSTVENLSKNNAWPDKTAKTVPEPETTAAESTDDTAVG
jgi:cytosine/uracil/thiamine/allantoin permease